MTTGAAQSAHRTVDQEAMDDLNNEVWRLAHLLDVMTGLLIDTPAKTGLQGNELDIITSVAFIASNIAKKAATDLDRLLMPPAGGSA